MCVGNANILSKWRKSVKKGCSAAGNWTRGAWVRTINVTYYTTADIRTYLYFPNLIPFLLIIWDFSSKWDHLCWQSQRIISQSIFGTASSYWLHKSRKNVEMQSNLQFSKHFWLLSRKKNGRRSDTSQSFPWQNELKLFEWTLSCAALFWTTLPPPQPTTVSPFFPFLIRPNQSLLFLEVWLKNSIKGCWPS